MSKYTYSVLIVSDRRALQGLEDKGGPAVVEAMKDTELELKETFIVEDDEKKIADILQKWCDEEASLILTTGGTGFAMRDVTPEATRKVIQKPAPGLCEAMRAKSLEITPHAMLSRQEAGINNKTLIINLPGGLNAISENLEVVKPVLVHALDLISDNKEKREHHQFVNK